MTNVNKITDGWKEYVMDDLLSDLETKYTWIGMGTGITPASQSNTALENEKDINEDAGKTRKTATITTDTSTGKLISKITLLVTEGNGNTLSEVGAFDSDAGGTDNMGNRSTFIGISKTSSMEMRITQTTTITIDIN